MREEAHCYQGWRGELIPPVVWEGEGCGGMVALRSSLSIISILVRCHSCRFRKSHSINLLTGYYLCTFHFRIKSFALAGDATCVSFAASSLNTAVVTRPSAFFSRGGNRRIKEEKKEKNAPRLSSFPDGDLGTKSTTRTPPRSFLCGATRESAHARMAADGSA